MRALRPFLLLVLLVVAFGAGLTWLLLLRFDAGDVYPPYSSLRSDPLGSRALFEALASLRVTVRRNYASLPEGADAAGATVLLLGCESAAWQFQTENDLLEMERFMTGGGRLVVAFSPLVTDPGFERQLSSAPKKEPPVPLLVSLRERWGVAFRFANLPRPGDDSPGREASLVDVGASLPPSIAWHTGVAFDRLAPVWSVLYARKGRPVVIVRPYGRGTLVLSSDSYPFSNEAVRKERQPELLSWWIGSARTVLFDETHLGLRENPGVMTLIRRYRLHGVVLAALVLAGLHLWRTATSFPPVVDEEPPDAVVTVAGRDSFAGLVNLMRRGIPPSRLLRVCIEEWARAPGTPAAKAAEMRALAQRRLGEKETVALYRRFAEGASARRVPDQKGVA